MEFGTSSWEEGMKATYNLNDAVFSFYSSGLSIRMDGSDGYAGQSRVVESEITGCGEMVSRARVILASQRHWRGGSINHSC
ncbi:hypothetical protein D5086_004121 [Populus alba]|uniref:Uncharacterized protein n=1 Tax=Populus alba TaxID=43335 RepID=A0ACC4CPW2_POPAL